MKVFFLELLITKYCNQKCSYCDVYPTTKFKNEVEVEVDIDFLNTVLKYFDYSNMFIELCGGEPGCVQNLDEVFKVLYNHKNVKGIQIMSNGLVRKKGYDWLTDNKVIYNEHLVKYIDGTNIVKFYEELDFEKFNNRRYVIVTTEKTIDSLLNNYQYFEKIGMFDEIFWYKILIDKTFSIDGFYNKLKEFYNKINHKDSQYHLERIQYFLDGKDCNISKKALCAINSPQPGIDFETKEILHCSAFVNKTDRVNFNNINCQKVLDMELFNLRDYCKTCYVFDWTDKKIKCIIAKNKGIYTNRSYWYEKFE